MAKRSRPGLHLRAGLLAAAAWALATAGCTIYPSTVPAEPAYDVDVRPVFLANCTRCHGNGPDGGSINVPPGSSSQGYNPVACFTQFGVNMNASGNGGCLRGAEADIGSFHSYIHSTDPTIEMPPPPSARLNSWELEMIDNWAAESTPICSRSSNPDPALFCP
jgi:hypothetical protein